MCRITTTGDDDPSGGSESDRDDGLFCCYSDSGLDLPLFLLIADESAVSATEAGDIISLASPYSKFNTRVKR